MEDIKELVKNQIEYLEQGNEGDTISTEDVINMFKDLLEQMEEE